MYRPYPELEIQWNPDYTNFVLKCPWVSIEVEVDPSDRENVLSQLHSGFAPEFLEFFSDYPISYFRPRALPEFAIQTLDFSWGRSSWPADQILEQSEIPGADGLYDPQTAYGLIRRQRLIRESSAKSTLGVYSELGQLLDQNEAAFLQVAREILRQTYHVTSQCDFALAPASLASPLDSKKINSYRRSELGHDRLVLRSLNELGVRKSQLSEVMILPETARSMELLREAAQHHPLAFCCLVGLFEGESFSKSDPLADLLARSSRPKAAEGIQKHFEINRDGNHAQIGESFVKDLGPVSEEAIRSAIFMTEEAVALGVALNDHFVRKVRSC